MDQTTYRFVRSILHTNRIELDGVGQPNIGLGGHYAKQQVEIYKGISQALARFMIKSNGEHTSDFYNNLKDFTDQLVTTAASAAPSSVLNDIGESGERALLAEIPVVTKTSTDEVESWIKDHPNLSDNVAASFAAGVMYEMRRHVNPKSTQIPTSVSTELASYAAWRALEMAPLDEAGAVAEKLNAMATSANQIIDDVQSKIAATTNSFGEASEQLRERTNAAIDAAESAAKQAGEFGLRTKDLGERIDAFEAAIDAKTQEAQHKLDSFLDAAKARTTYQHIVMYWDDRAKASRGALDLSSLALVTLLIVLPAIAIYENEAVIALLKHLIDATYLPLGTEPNAVVLTVATVSRLVVITIPLALYFWLIKLIVRFNMRSMLLMDDARQRSTIIETYYRMIEQQAATKEDRALILQALCRPPPGHGSDSIEPPNFTEVIEKGIGKA